MAAYAREVGLARAGFSGPEPVSFTELKAYREVAEAPLTGWEGRVLHELSQTYVSQLNDARDPNCPPPWSPRNFDRKAVADGLDKMFRTMASKGK